MSFELYLKVKKEFEKHSGPNGAKLVEFISDCIKIKIDEVVEYFYKTSEKEIWADSDFANLAPPFNSFWIEYSPPKKSNSNGKMIDVPKRFLSTRHGMLFKYAELNPSDQNNFRKWVCNAYYFSDVSFYQNEPTLFKAIMFISLNENGEMIFSNTKNGASEFDPGMKYPVSFYHRGEKDFGRRIYMVASNNEERGSLMRNLCACASLPMLFAIYLMHCKNVSVGKHIYKDHEVREYIKRHGCSPVKYYELNIEPFKNVMRRNGSDGANGPKKALHLCRGHFKNFENGKGLFGKVHGLFWWPQLLRGNSEYGTIKKDYNIKSPTIKN